MSKLSVADLFRSDGSPRYVLYDRSGKKRPARVVVSYGQMLMEPIRRAVSAEGNPVNEVWEATAIIWLEALSLTKRSRIGKEAYHRFMASWQAFQARYDIKTKTVEVLL